MGILDSILGMNTSSAQQGAANQANGLLSNAMGQNSGVIIGSADAANKNLMSGYGAALGNVATGFGNARTDATNYGDKALGALSGGVNTAVGTLQNGSQAFQPWVSGGQGASGMLSNALGLNGAGGNAAATAAFQAAPGYQWQQDQATDAAARKAASLGMDASGSTLDAITRLSSNLANQGYGNWLSNLNGVSSTGLGAANSANANNSQAAGYQYGGGTGAAGINTGLGTTLSGQDTGGALASAGLNSGLGNNLANVATNEGNSLVNNSWQGTGGIVNANMAAAKAQDSATNANNGIFSKLLGTALSPVTGALSNSIGGALSSATGGWL